MSRKKNKHRKSAPRAQLMPELAELVTLIEQTQSRTLSDEERAKLKTLATTTTFLIAELQKKQTSLDRLRRILFGAPTEKTRSVLELPPSEHATDLRGITSEQETKPRPHPPGHGRHSAAAYTGADKVSVRHPSLQGGQECPSCEKGRVYTMSEPSVRVRITGMAPLGAKIYECDRLRCNLCGEVYTAAAPEGVGDEKYDATATSMVGLLKYGTGLNFGSRIIPPRPSRSGFCAGDPAFALGSMAE